MKVRILISMAGMAFSYSPGDVVEVGDELADQWIGAKVAEPVRTINKKYKPVETAAVEHGKPRPRG